MEQVEEEVEALRVIVMMMTEVIFIGQVAGRGVSAFFHQSR